MPSTNLIERSENEYSSGKDIEIVVFMMSMPCNRSALVETMTSEIKSGPEILEQFLSELSAGDGMDAQTLAAIKVLHSVDKLTRTRLLQVLEQIRVGTQSPQD
jgi:hypothetical protein